MEQSQHGLVSGLGDPKAVWDALAAHHEQKRPATRFASYEALLGIQKRDDESLPALALRVVLRASVVERCREMRIDENRARIAPEAQTQTRTRTQTVDCSR